MPASPPHSSEAASAAGASGPGCPFHADAGDRYPQPRVNPMNPPPIYAQWGAEAPVRRVTQWNGRPAWFVTRFEHIRALLMDKRLSADASHPSYPAQTAALQLVRRDYQVFAQMDPPAHGDERRLVSAEFGLRSVEQMRPKVQALVDGLIDRMLAKPGRADLVADFAMPLPCSVIGSLLGVPESDHPLLHDFAERVSSRLATQEEAAASIKAFCDGYLTELVERKNADPQDDLLSRLIVDHMRPGTITAHKVVSLARLFLTAGHESTSGTLGLGLAALLYNPEQLELLRRDPSLINGAVEEILRYTDVTHSGRLRVAKEDIEIGGVTIRAGEAVIMHQPTADREPELFPDPHRFDITRAPRPHLAFGIGIHGCVGQPLARVELQLGIGSLVRRIPDLRPVLPIEELRFNSTLAIYGLESLPVAFGTD